MFYRANICACGYEACQYSWLHLNTCDTHGSAERNKDTKYLFQKREKAFQNTADMDVVKYSKVAL